MRRRSREITVFSLSMMDVITGAMGAFLIVMVVLARYYESDPENRENVVALKAELTEVRDRMREIGLAAQRMGAEGGDITQALAKAKANLSDADKGADKLREQLDQAKQEIDRQDETINDLLKRRAFAVAGFWDCPGVDVDIYVWDTQVSAKDDAPVAFFDPNRRQGHRWTDDFRADFDTRGYETWLVSSSVTDTEHKVYVKLAEPSKVSAPCRVHTSITHSAHAKFSEQILSSGNSWAYIFRVRQNSNLEDGYFELFEPSNSEIEAERRAVSQRARGS